VTCKERGAASLDSFHCRHRVGVDRSGERGELAERRVCAWRASLPRTAAWARVQDERSPQRHSSVRLHYPSCYRTWGLVIDRPSAQRYAPTPASSDLTCATLGGRYAEIVEHPDRSDTSLQLRNTPMRVSTSDMEYGVLFGPDGGHFPLFNNRIGVRCRVAMCTFFLSHPKRRSP